MHATNIENNWNWLSTSMTRKVCDWFNSVGNGRTGSWRASPNRGHILAFIELFTAENQQLLEMIGSGVRFQLVSTKPQHNTWELMLLLLLLSCQSLKDMRSSDYRFSRVCKKYTLEVVVITWPYAIWESNHNYCKIYEIPNDNWNFGWNCSDKKYELHSIHVEIKCSHEFCDQLILKFVFLLTPEKSCEWQFRYMVSNYLKSIID